MQIFLYLLYGIEFVIAVLLILVILIQRSKAGGGLGGLATTSSGVEEAFGSDAGNVLVKVTWFLGAVFLATTISIGILQGFAAQHENRDMAGEGYMSSSEAPKKDGAALTGEKPEEKKVEEKKTDGTPAPSDKKGGETPAPADTKTEDKKVDDKSAPADK